MSTRNNLIWKAIKTLCWLIFFGYCIQAGALLFNFIFSLFKPEAARNFYLGFDASPLYARSTAMYALFTMILILGSAMKAFVFHLVLRLFRTIDLNKPFSEEVSRSIVKLSIYPLIVGILSAITKQFSKALSEKGLDTGGLNHLWADGGAYLMMAAILFVVAFIFQKGLELQKENDLTV